MKIWFYRLASYIWTVLHSAVWANELKVVCLLLEEVAREGMLADLLLAQTRSGELALHYAGPEIVEVTLGVVATYADKYPALLEYADQWRKTDKNAAHVDDIKKLITEHAKRMKEIEVAFHD